jgi:hypothetical protein
MRALARGFRLVEVASHEYARRGGVSKVRVLRVGHKYVCQDAAGQFD